MSRTLKFPGFLFVIRGKENTSETVLPDLGSNLFHSFLIPSSSVLHQFSISRRDTEPHGVVVFSSQLVCSCFNEVHFSKSLKLQKHLRITNISINNSGTMKVLCNLDESASARRLALQSQPSSSSFCVGHVTCAFIPAIAQTKQKRTSLTSCLGLLRYFWYFFSLKIRTEATSELNWAP